MARETITRDVDGRLYEFTQFGTTQSLKVLTRITKIVGEPMAIAMGGAAMTPGGPDISSDLLGKAVHSLIDRLDEREVIDIVKLLTASENMRCDHRPIVFDDHYCGEIKHLINVLLASLEVQYGNFFDGLKERIFGGPSLESVVPPPGM